MVVSCREGGRVWRRWKEIREREERREGGREGKGKQRDGRIPLPPLHRRGTVS